MVALKIFRIIIHFMLKIIFLPIQIVLTVLISMLDFASGVISVVFGLVGGIFVLLAFSFLFTSPIDWKMFMEALIFGSLIGVLPHLVRYCGDTIFHMLQRASIEQFIRGKRKVLQLLKQEVSSLADHQSHYLIASMKYIRNGKQENY